MGHPGQGICKRIRKGNSKVKNFMEPKIIQTRRMRKKLWELGNGSSGQVEGTEA
jgi:hypothetical protein